MKVIIAGSRSIKDYDRIAWAVELSGFDITEVVSGCAKGVDQQGERWADVRGKPCKQFPATWNNPDGTLNRSAGIKRNIQMAHYADALVAVWDGKSRGTKHMIDYMTKLGKPVYVLKNEI